MHPEVSRAVAVAALVAGVAAGCGIDIAGTMTSAEGDAGSDASLPGRVPPSGDAQVDGAAATIDAGDGSVISVCGDLQTSPLDCGVCGHSCLGGTCVAGKCQPVVLVTGDTGLGAVVVDATTIYYAAEDAGYIRKIPIGGGAPVDVHYTGKAPHALVLDGDRIFWNDQFGAGVFVFGGAEQRQDFSNGVRAIAKTPNGLYMVTSAGIEYWNRGLTNETRSFSNSGASSAIVTTGGFAYWAAGGQIRRVALGDDSVSNVVTNTSGTPTSMATDGTYVYWTTSTKVLRAAIAAGVGWTPVLLVAGETDAGALEVDASGLYWVDLAGGAVRHAPLAGGAATTLATTMPQRVPPPWFQHMLSLTANAVYFTSTAEGTLSRIAK